MIKQSSVSIKLLVIVLTTILLLSTAACATSSSVDADITINLTASSNAFDKSTMTVPAGATVAIVFDNKDGNLHNFALYETSAVANNIFKGELISKKKITYIFIAPSTPGAYFFRCDVHPFTMAGEFIVT